MHFILAPGCIARFEHLRHDYENQKHVNLNQEPSIIGVPVFFGGTDVASRNKQVTFLEKVKAVLNPYLSNEEQIKTESERQTYIIAGRFLLAACLHVENEIGRSKRNSALFRIIEDNLRITTDNFLDEEDKVDFCLTAKRIINTPNAFQNANETLKNRKLKPFTEKEWNRFSKFLEDKCHQRELTFRNNNFPFISLAKPFCGAVFSYVGATLGAVAAEGITNSSSAISPRVQLTALVGSTLLVLTPAGTTGVALFAPMIATKLLTSFCTISLAHVMGNAAGYLGQFVGIGFALPFDLAYNLLWSVCSIVSRYYSKAPPIAAIDGIRLCDGATIIAGIPVQLLSDQEIPEGCTKKVLEITENGEIKIDGVELKYESAPMQIPSDVLEGIKNQFSMPENDLKPSGIIPNAKGTPEHPEQVLKIENIDTESLSVQGYN